MKASAALIADSAPEEGLARVVQEAIEGLAGEEPSLAAIFASSHYAQSCEEVLAAVRSGLGPVPLIGAVAESVISGPREIEDGPALVAWVISGVGDVETFAMQYLATPSGGLFAGNRFEDSAPYLLVCDPFTFPAAQLLDHLNKNVPGALAIGGMAAGSGRPGTTRLFYDDQVLVNGAVGARLEGARVDLLVSQGCRPIGSPYTVTRAEGNVVHELGGRPPFQRLQDLVSSLPEPDRLLLADGGLQVGIAIDEYRQEQRRGDFLVRAVVGADAESGAIAVGSEIEVGQTLQFHVRDAASADEDLREALEREAALLGQPGASAALLFTCNGRGTRLFSEADHDAKLLAKLLGEIPVAGFFCAGEIGPVGGKNFLHGFTASAAIFR
ncbi:MAG TPA: FIST N-terminal domain-containing protein [Acidimicrobiales bacterium]|nr:FIST N-terminal domain-containing protein [Acidimicrobiales bacterium]